MKALPILLLTAASLSAQENLDVLGDSQNMVDRYLTPIAERYLAERAAKVAAIRTPAQVAERQAYVRRKFTEAVGGWPEKTPLNARITGTVKGDGYRVEKLIFESLPRFYVTANVFVPAAGTPPYPALLGVAGHSSNGKASALYQRAWISLARRGILVLAYDPPGQGERSEFFDRDLGRSSIGIGTREHTMAGLQCLLTGTNYARYEVWDGIRAFDYLLTRADVDGKRVAVAGNSGGGTQSSYLAVAEPRLAVAAPSCYLTSWEKQWIAPGPQDAEQVFASFIRDGLNFGDFILAFAPKPLKMMTAIRDFFPIEGARNTFAEAKRIYEVMGAADKAGYFEYDDTHGWSKPRREATYQWMERWLNGRQDGGSEPEFELHTDTELNASPTGQVLTSFTGAETVQSLNRALASRQAAGRRGRVTGETLARRLEAQAPASAPPAASFGTIERNGYRIEKIAIDSEAGIRLPALVFVPSGEGRRPGVLYLNSAGKAADARAGGDVESLARSGSVVMAVDLRGWGETGLRAGASGYGGGYQTAMRALLVGKTMAGMQTGDALRAAAVLAGRPDVDASRLSVIGKGNGGVIALFAAALEPRIRKVACERSVPSYLAIARARIHENTADLVIPGVLREFDLPDVARLISPRPLWLVNPATPAGGRAADSDVKAAYGAAATIVDRPEGWPADKIYRPLIER